jgi:sucrose-6-phosphate hydrolase SacC (GH32 family)
VEALQQVTAIPPRPPLDVPARRYAADPHRKRAVEPLRLHVFIDDSVIDVFVDDRHAFSTRAHPTLRNATGVRAYAVGGRAELRSARLFSMAGARARHAAGRLP